MNYVGALICAAAAAATTAATATLYGPQGGTQRRIYTADGPYLYPAPQNASYFDQAKWEVGGGSRCGIGMLSLLLEF